MNARIVCVLNINMELSDSNQKHDNGLWFEPSETEINSTLKLIAESTSVKDQERVFYVFGYGKQTKNAYVEIANHPDFEVIWYAFMGTGLLKLLSPFIAGQSGLIKVHSFKNLNWLIEKLTHLSMVGLFSFSKEIEEGFLDYMKKFQGKHDISPENYIKTDSTYFSLIYDGDNYETESGLLGIVSTGENCPRDIKVLKDNFGEYGYLGKKPLP